MKTKFLVILMIQLFLFCSCAVDRIYTSGSYGSLKTYTAKPFYDGEKKSKMYVSGSVSTGKHEQEGGRFDDTKTIVTLNAHKSISGRNYNLHYGLGGSYGNYKFKGAYENAIIKNEKQSFYSANMLAGINYTLSRPKVNYRFIGLEMTYNYEFGPYQDKLDRLNNLLDDSSILIVNQKSMFALNLNSEYVFKLSEKSNLNLGFYGGYVFVDRDFYYRDDATFSGFSLGLDIDRYVFSAIFESGYGGVKSSKFGFTYQL